MESAAMVRISDKANNMPPAKAPSRASESCKRVASFGPFDHDESAAMLGN
jgi:hypothetical protein